MYAHSHAACRPTLDTGIRSRRRPVGCTLSALEFFFIHCPNGRLGQDLGFGGFVSAVKLPELLNTNLPTVRANIVSLYCKDKDLTPKDQDKDKDLKNVLKKSSRTRTRTRINWRSGNCGCKTSVSKIAWTIRNSLERRYRLYLLTCVLFYLKPYCHS